MGKAIYAIIDENLYKLQQETSEPVMSMKIPSETYATTIFDSSLKTVKEKIRINTLESIDVKSNKELALLMTQKLISDKVLSIPTIDGNDFQLYLDYSIFQGEKELAHSITISPVKSRDIAILLGVDSDNELSYRRGKTLSSEIEIDLTSLGNSSTLPIGIMKTCSCKDSYRFFINELTIYMNGDDISSSEDTSCDHICESCCRNRVCFRRNVHNSIYNTPYPICCKNSTNTIGSSLKSSIPLFSSIESGFIIQYIDMGFIPRKLTVDFKALLANLLVMYEEKDITDILEENATVEEDPSGDDTTDPDDNTDVNPDSGESGNDSSTETESGSENTEG